MLPEYIYPTDLFSLSDTHPEAFRHLQAISFDNEVLTLYREYRSHYATSERKAWIRKRLQDRQEIAKAFGEPDPLARLLGPDYEL
jgi:hypothetical protein